MLHAVRVSWPPGLPQPVEAGRPASSTGSRKLPWAPSHPEVQQLDVAFNEFSAGPGPRCCKSLGRASFPGPYRCPISALTVPLLLPANYWASLRSARHPNTPQVPQPSVQESVVSQEAAVRPSQHPKKSWHEPATFAVGPAGPIRGLVSAHQSKPCGARHLWPPPGVCRRLRRGLTRVSRRGGCSQGRLCSLLSLPSPKGSWMPDVGSLPPQGGSRRFCADMSGLYLAETGAHFHSPGPS